MNSDHFSLHLLGTPRLSIHHQPVIGLSVKAQWLLAMLALAPGHSVTRDFAAAQLWPASKSANPRGLLRCLLRELRMTLGDAADRLSMGSHTHISLDLTDAFVDLLAFDRDVAQGDPVSLRRAVSLYRSELLSGAQEEWIIEARQRRADAYEEAILRLTAHSPALDTKQLDTRFPTQVPLPEVGTSERVYPLEAQETKTAAIRKRLQSVQAQMNELATEIAELARQLDSLFTVPAPPCAPAEADALCQKGVEALTRGELDLAQEYLLRALALNPQPLEEARIVDQLGTIAVWHGSRYKARIHFERSFDIRAASKDQKGLVSSLLRLGDVAETFPNAREYYVRALQVAEYDDNVEGMAWSHWSLASAPISWRQWQPARLPETLYQLRQAVQHFAQIYNIPGIAICMDGIARLLFELHRAKDALYMIHAADRVRMTYNVARLTNEQEHLDTELRKAELPDACAQQRDSADILSDTSVQGITSFVMARLTEIETDCSNQ